jgi:ABC-type nitrate/sulfonate/bicarbonate transport system ATPase subunit
MATAIDKAPLDVARGHFVTLLGASGCGKSPLPVLVTGLHRPPVGQVHHLTDGSGELLGRFFVAFPRPAASPGAVSGSSRWCGECAE